MLSPSGPRISWCNVLFVGTTSWIFTGIECQVNQVNASSEECSVLGLKAVGLPEKIKQTPGSSCLQELSWIMELLIFCTLLLMLVLERTSLFSCDLSL